MRALVQQVRRIADVDATVLITGETGAGKDAIAELLHATGQRRATPFVRIDCPSLSPSLFESELFGHERGAFTGATSAKPGRFELAERGTVYLDKISELPIDLQGKLLRVVEEKRVQRVGGTTSLDMRARIVASADARIEQAVRDGLFRDDLYHRLRVLPLAVPPLRTRPADILPLARAFLRESAARLARRPASLTPDAVRALRAYSWPGNVRELRHIIERAVLNADGDLIDAGGLAIEVLDDPHAYFGLGEATRPTLDEVEQRYIDLILREVGGNQTQAAAILGISRKALWEKRKRRRS
jgi:DNA-binding NtrC family response regulator